MTDDAGAQHEAEDPGEEAENSYACCVPGCDIVLDEETIVRACRERMKGTFWKNDPDAERKPSRVDLTHVDAEGKEHTCSYPCP